MNITTKSAKRVLVNIVQADRSQTIMKLVPDRMHNIRRELSGLSKPRHGTRPVHSRRMHVPMKINDAQHSADQTIVHAMHAQDSIVLCIV